MELIPGLPNDIARDCLLHVTYKEFPTISSVSKGWKSEIELPEFRRQRKQTCNSQKVIVMAQAQVGPNQSSTIMKFRVPVYSFTLLEPDTGCWSELPPVPGLSNGLPMFCQAASVGSDLVVLGGLDPVTWEVSNSVFIFNFVSGTWRRVADMPGVRRSFFGCTSDFDRMVYVVGGHDGEKNALRSVIAYDVEKDEWVTLPNMARERDECKAIFHRGKLHVIGGYRSDMQGRFEKSAEVFDIATWQWDHVQEDFLKSAMCPRTCVCDEDGDLYMCCGRDVIALKGTTWKAVAKLPADVYNTGYVTTWRGKLFVIGSASFGESYVLDLKSCNWTKMGTPEQYSGHVQSGCYLEI